MWSKSVEIQTKVSFFSDVILVTFQHLVDCFRCMFVVRKPDVTSLLASAGVGKGDHSSPDRDVVLCSTSGTWSKVKRCGFYFS